MISAPWLNDNADDPIRVNELTSHIDVLPTLLGLVGYDTREKQIALGAKIQDHTVIPLPGADLGPVMVDPTKSVVEPDGTDRESVLFITYDTITNYLEFEEPTPPHYDEFLKMVDHLKETGIGVAKGPVMEPCCIQAVRSKEWKLARYFDPRGGATDQWELYYLTRDALEETNLVSWNDAGEPVPEPSRLKPDWPVDAQQLDDALTSMRTQLDTAVTTYLGGPPSVQEPYVLEAIT